MNSNVLLSEYKNLLVPHVDDAKLKKLFDYVGKLERLAEVAAELRETISDSYSSTTEQEYAFEKLDEAYEEYEFFLENQAF